MKDMRSEKCKTCIHTKVCGKDLNTVGEMFVPPHPILGKTEEAWERFKEREAQGFPCEDRLEIVRCKNCKHFDPDGANTDGWGWCNKNDSDWRVDDFCSWGKRGKR